jgi:hypothetical protein
MPHTADIHCFHTRINNVSIVRSGHGGKSGREPERTRLRHTRGDGQLWASVGRRAGFTMPRTVVAWATL